MKIRIALAFIAFFLVSIEVIAQAPQGFSYQAVVRNEEGVLLTNAAVGVQVSVTRDSIGGTLVYQELHQSGMQTNQNGLLTLVIGEGTPQWSTNFSQINWGDGPYFVQVDIDPDGGSNYTLTTSSQLLSVPYALFAANTGGGDLPQGANEGDILYWNDNSWQILPIGSNYQKLCVCNGQLRWAPYQPSVNTVMAVFDVTGVSARMEVEVVDNGCSEGGPCIIYSTNPNPTIENSSGPCAFGNTMSPYFDPGVYSVQLDGLEPATTYYARAYMRNSLSFDYGDVFSFTTTEFELPAVTLDSVHIERLGYNTTFSNYYDSLPQFHFIGDFSVTLQTTGDSQTAELGIVWDYETSPDLSDNFIEYWSSATPGNYSTQREWNWDSIPQMLPNTDIYFRAFARVGGQTVYSNEIMVHTQGSEGSVGAAGGYIVYDKGVYTDGWRYLEISPVDYPDSAQWGCEGVYIFATGAFIGYGLENTNFIVQTCSNTNTAAGICDNYSYGGYSDWFLPSHKEALVMISSSNALSIIPDMDCTYWTSTVSFGWFSALGVSSDNYVNYNFLYQPIIFNPFLCVRPMRRF